MKLKKVINIFGGPCVGKSFIASELSNLLKKERYIAEMANEFAKELVYDQRFDILNKDQLYIFAEQHRRIYRLVDHVEYIVTDCPLLLGCVYFEYNRGIYDEDSLTNIIIKTFNKYPNVNILLKRNPKYGYDEVGRYQTYEQALNVDKDILRWLKQATLNFTEIISDENTVSKIFEMIKE